MFSLLVANGKSHGNLHRYFCQCKDREPSSRLLRLKLPLPLPSVLVLIFEMLCMSVGINVALRCIAWDFDASARSGKRRLAPMTNGIYPLRSYESHKVHFLIYIFFFSHANQDHKLFANRIRVNLHRFFNQAKLTLI